MSLIIKDGITQWDIHTSDESQRGMADNKEDGESVCASNANSTAPRKQDWKEEKKRKLQRKKYVSTPRFISHWPNLVLKSCS